MEVVAEDSYTCDENVKFTINSKEIACINYPGVVQNPNTAIDTLGGLSKLSQVLKHLYI